MKVSDNALKLEMEIEEVKRLYLEEKRSANYIAKLYGVHPGIVTSRLRRENIEVRGKKKELPMEEVVQLYTQNLLSTAEIGKRYGVAQNTVAKRLREENIEIRNTGVSVNKRIQSNFWEKIDTPQKAYILGFLLTDGSVDGNSNSIILEIQEGDLHILETIREYMQIDSKIIPTNGKQRLYYTNKKHVEDIAKFGMTVNKTYIMKGIKLDLIPSEFHSHFLRGMYDGDGLCSFTSTSNYIGFCSYYEETVNDFKQKMIETLNFPDAKISKNTVFRVSWSAKQNLLDFYNYIYKDCEEFCLIRKKEKLFNYIENF